jgi:hypothetical protein
MCRLPAMLSFLLVLTGLSLPATAVGASKVHAAAVYSKSAGGYWVLARVMLVGCEKSATISASGASYVVSITKSPGPICPQIAHEENFALFVPATSKPASVKIDTGTGTALPYSVGTSDPEK